MDKEATKEVKIYFSPDKDNKDISSCMCTYLISEIAMVRPTLGNDGVPTKDYSNLVFKSGKEVTTNIPYAEMSKTFKEWHTK